ncbi:MAG TPA: hypothetical protein VMT03_08220 [Polyangia bacterium]|nr:hypothetical protein [Polyangia bacterium]
MALLSLVMVCEAKAAGKRVGVPKFNGAQEALVRKKVMAVLKAHGYALVRSRDMQAAVASSGGSLDSDDGIKSVAKELALVAIVTGDVSAKRAKLVVHDGGEGSVLGDATFAGANPHKLAAEVGATFWRKLGADIGRGHVPSGAKKDQKESAPEAGEEEAGAEASGGTAGEPAGGAAAGGAAAGGEEAAAPPPSKSKVKMESEAAPEESEPRAPSGLPWLDLQVGGGGMNRSLSYHQDYDPVGNQLQSYSLPFGPVGIARGVIYPFDPLVGGLLGNWGFEGRAMIGFVSSTLSSGDSFTNTVHDFSGGTRYRFPFGGTNDVYLSVRYGEDAFTFNAANPADRATLRTPDTIYHYVRPGLGVQFALANAVSLELNAGYRFITNHAGPQMLTFFPRLGVQGADAEIDLGYAFNDLYGIRAGVEWRRYWYSFNVKPNDNFLVGGAVDQSFIFTVSLVFTLGSTPKAPEPEAAPAPKSKAKGEDQGEGGGQDTGEGGGDADKTSGGGAE